MCLSKLFGRTQDVPSPSDIVKDIGTQYYEMTNRVEIDLNHLNIPFTKPPKIWVSPIPDTDSMDPVFDHGHGNIYIAGSDEDNQNILLEWLSNEWFYDKRANIIVYQLPGQNPIVHRLDHVAWTGKGRKWWFKGDNNISKDPTPASDNDIKWLLIGTIY